MNPINQLYLFIMRQFGWLLMTVLGMIRLSGLFVLILATLSSSSVAFAALSCDSTEVQQTFTFDSSTNTWPNNTSSKKFTVGSGDNQVELTFTASEFVNSISGDPSLQTLGNKTTLQHSSSGSVQPNTALTTLTMTSSRPINKLSFAVHDLDYSSNNFRDRMIMTTNAGNGYSSAITRQNSSGTFTIDNSTGSVIAGNQSCSSNDNTCSINVDYNYNNITYATGTFYAAHSSGNSTQQYIGYSDFSWCLAKKPVVRVNKITLGGTGGPYSFTATNLTSNPPSITTSATNTATPASPIAITASFINTDTTITENPVTGYSLTNAVCTDANRNITGNPASFGSVSSGNTLLIPASSMRAGADITCTFTNTKIPTGVLRLNKVSQGGTGTFAFALSNTTQTAGNVTTTSANSLTQVDGNTAVAGIQDYSIATANTAITIQENSLPAGWKLDDAKCVSASTGNVVGSLSGNTYTIPASSVGTNESFTCTFSNAKAATVKVQKQTVGAVSGSGNNFTFSQTNLASNPGGIATTAQNTPTPVSPAAINIINLNTDVSIIETPYSNYALTDASCTDVNSAVTGNTGSIGGQVNGNKLIIPAANVRPGSDFTCLFTNTVIPNSKLTLYKISSGGIGSFGYTLTNTKQTQGTVTTTAANTLTQADSNTTIAGAQDFDINNTGTAITIQESTIPAGWTIDSASCTNRGGTTIGSLSGTTYTIPSSSVTSGQSFSCIFINKKIPTVKVQKVTLGGSGGSFTFAQTNLASTPASISTTAANTPAPAAPTAIQVVNTNNPVTLTETPSSGYSLNSASCVDANRDTTGNPLSFGSLSGNALTIPAANLKDGADITCTFTNGVRPTLQLSKVWGAGSSSADSVTIGATTGGSANTTAFSTTGNTNRSSNVVSVTVGNTITLPAETGNNLANYDTSLSCLADGGVTANSLSSTNGQVSNTLVVAAGDAGKSIVCNYTNTRKSTTFRIAKVWVNGLVGNVANLGATTGLSNNTAAFSSTASTATNGTAVTVYAGETATLPAETMSSGTLANYTTAVSCSAGTLTGTNGQSAGNTLAITAAATATSPITCTYTNSRKSASLTLQKIWANAKINDAVTVTATGLTSLSAVANTASETDAAAGQTVYAGDSITLGESFTVGSASNYNSSLACSGNATALSGNVLTVNTADNAITCSYTNSRIAQQLSLSKLWQNAVSGHTATATTTGVSNNPTFSSTSTGNNSTAGSAVTVYAGDVVTLPVETLGGGASAAQYDSTVNCDGGTVLARGLMNRTITISNSTNSTVCTYINARKSATLTLAKIWSAGSIAGNTVTVSSSGFGNNASSGTSTATAAGNTTTGTSVTVYAGESGSISETFGTGTASNYTATLACSGNSTALSGNTLTINPADTAINCSYTNTVIGADLAIDKTGTSGVTQGNTVSYSIKVWNKGPATASSSTFTDTVPTALTNVSWSCSASGSAVCGTASGSGNAISVTTGALPVNASSTAPTTGSYLTFTVTGTAGTAGNISNTASIAVTSGTDPVSSNNSSSASTSISAPAAIIADTPQKEARFVISPNLPTIYRGQAGTQLITINNVGPDDASGTVATFKPRTQTGVTVTSVKIAGGANCSFSAGAWSCPVGSVANGGSFQLEVSYDTTSSATLGTAIQADIKVASNEFNPGSGVGETLYKVWGSNTTNETRPNGAFWAGFKGPQGSTPASGYDDETTPIANAWPIGQVSPTGSYLVTAVPGINNNIYAASSTTASPMINRIISNMSTDPARSVTLPSMDSTSAGDNRRAWEFRTGVFVPQTTNVTLCIGNTSVGIDDGAYIVLDGQIIGTQDSYAPGGYVSATVSFPAGYHTLSYRILNQNTQGGSAEVAQGLYGAIGILYNGSCNVAGFDAWVNTQIPASINIVEKQVVSITGQVFEDNSGSTAVSSNAYNGVKNTGEAGIAGSSVSITNCNSSTIATTTTDANGDYSFSLSPTDLPAGNFCIAQTNLTGYSSVSGTTGYSRATDRITISNTAATSYGNHNFGDARLTALLSEDGQQTINAGGVADYPHRLTAQSVLTISSLNQTTSQQPANSSDQSWQAVVYRDSNCNAKVDSGESLFSQSLPLSLKNAEEVCLVQRVYAPATASMGAQHIGQLQASFSVTLADNSQITGSSLQRQDTTLLGSAGLTMQKGVRSVASCPSTAADTSGFSVQNQVQSGGYLEYEITYRNNTTKNLVDVSLKDSVPTGTVYKSVSCLSSPSGSCNASHNNGALLWQTGGTLLPNQQGKVRFCVQVP